MVASVINLSDLDGSQGFVIEGVNQYERSGYSVDNAGDINGDGIDDIVIGAPGGYNFYYYGSGYTSGKAYVVFGDSSVGNDGTLELSALDGNNGFVINESEGNRFGFSVSSAGDVNGDGIDDLIVGAPDADISGNYSNEGESYVIFGSNSGFDASIDAETLDGSDGFVIVGINEGDNSGRSVSSAGDVNGDGINDLIIGAPNAEPNNSYSNYSSDGESYVVFGGSSLGDSGTLELSTLDGSNGFNIAGIDRYDNSGRSVSSAGDINGDGIDDLIIGAPYAGEYVYYGSNSQGESYVVFGGNDVGDSGTLELSSLDGSNGFVISGVDSYDNAGRSVSSAGDVNGDGINDLIIGAPNADPSGNYSYEGASYVVFGGNDVGDSGTLELSALDGTNGFAISGVDRFDNAGDSVSSAGDVDGDGINDLIIGAPNAGVSGNYGSEGQSYVIFGSSDGFAANIDLANLDEIDGIIINGANGGDNAGTSVSGAGDINGDGVDDVLIGAPYADPNGNDDAGESYVVFGVVPLELIGTEENDILTAGTGNDLLSGLGGDDILSGLAGRDEIFGGSGNDLITGGDGNDTVFGEDGNDNISGNDGNDSLVGDSGRDDILGGDGDDIIDGGSGPDRLLGEAGNDNVSGGTGSDRLLGGDGDDTLSGGLGNDTLEGNAGNDSVVGNAGNDNISGNDGNDTLSGETGDDTLIGGNGIDLISGNMGNDILIGVDNTNPNSNFGTGEQDTLTGGGDSDAFILADTNSIFYDDGNNFAAGDDDFALITDFNPSNDTIQLQGSADLYELDFFTSSEGTIDAKLTYDAGVTATAETIAVLEDVGSDLSIDDSAFTFV